MPRRPLLTKAGPTRATSAAVARPEHVASATDAPSAGSADMAAARGQRQRLRCYARRPIDAFKRSRNQSSADVERARARERRRSEGRDRDLTGCVARGSVSSRDAPNRQSTQRPIEEPTSARDNRKTGTPLSTPSRGLEPRGRQVASCAKHEPVRGEHLVVSSGDKTDALLQWLRAKTPRARL